MEDENVAAQDDAAAAASAVDNESAEKQREIEKLMSERADLKSELEAAATQVEIFRATVEELQGSRDTLEGQIRDLKEKLSVLAMEKAEEVDRAKTEKRALEAVAARAAELEGEVSRLQHDLVGAMSEGDDKAAEAEVLRVSSRRLEGEVKELQEKLLEANRIEDELKVSLQNLASEKNALEKKKDEAEASAVDLQSKVESLKRELQTVSSEKGEEAKKLKSALAELEAANSEKMHVAENGKRSIDGSIGEMYGHKTSWKLMAVAAGAVTAVTATTFFLRYAKSRSD